MCVWPIGPTIFTICVSQKPMEKPPTHRVDKARTRESDINANRLTYFETDKENLIRF